MNIFRHTTIPQQLYERMKDYKLLLAGQIVTLINYLVIYQIFLAYSFEGWEKIFLAFMGIVSIAMNVIAYLLLRDLTESRFLRRLVIILVSTGIFIAIYSGGPFAPVDTPWLQRLLITISPSCVLVSFSILLYLMVYDIFKEKHDIIYRLWGSACIFMLIGVLFSSIYFIIEIIFPAEFSIHGMLDIHQFVKCYTFSFYTLSGIDQPYSDLGMIVKNIAVVESIFSNLYIVLLVGRLLSK